MFIRNAWYVAAWADEIGETPLARRICDEPVVLFRDRAEPRRRAAGHVLPSRRAAAHRQGRRAGPPVRLSRTDLRPLRRLRTRPGSGPHRRAHPRAQLPGGRAGRSSCGSGWATRRRPIPRRSCHWPYHNDSVNWPHKHTMYPIKGSRHADGRQPDGPDASRLHPRLDHRRQPVAACRGEDGDRAHAARASSSPAGC